MSNDQRDPRVINIRNESPTENYHYVGRPTVFGNPFVIGKDGTREEVVAKYRARILTSPKMIAKVKRLRGLDLGCYCAPLACHADVLLEIANE